MDENTGVMDVEKSPVTKDGDTFKKQMVVPRVEKHEIVHRTDMGDDILKCGLLGEFNGSPVHCACDNGLIEVFQEGSLSRRECSHSGTPLSGGG